LFQYVSYSTRKTIIAHLIHCTFTSSHSFIIAALIKTYTWLCGINYMSIIIRECWSFHWHSSLPRWCPTPSCYGFHFISRIMVNHMMCEFCNSVPNQLCLCDVSFYVIVKNIGASLQNYTLLHIVYITTEICDNSRFAKIFFHQIQFT